MDSSAEFRGGAILHRNDVVTARIKPLLLLLFIVPLLQGDQILHLATSLSRFDPSFLSFFLLLVHFSLHSSHWLQKWTTTSGRNYNQGRGESLLLNGSREQIFDSISSVLFWFFFFFFLFLPFLSINREKKGKDPPREIERKKGGRRMEGKITMINFIRFEIFKWENVER